MPAFSATFSDLKLVKTRQVAQLIFEIPIEQFDAAYEILGGVPVPGKERWFGIAAINTSKEVMPDTQHNTIPPDTRPGQPPAARADREKMDWRDMQPAAQAGIRCDDAVFKAFLCEQYGNEWKMAGGLSDQCVRLICGVDSRSELGTKQAARVLWHQLDRQFQAWKVAEHA